MYYFTKEAFLVSLLVLLVKIKSIENYKLDSSSSSLASSVSAAAADDEYHRKSSFEYQLENLKRRENRNYDVDGIKKSKYESIQSKIEEIRALFSKYGENIVKDKKTLNFPRNFERMVNDTVQLYNNAYKVSTRSSTNQHTINTSASASASASSGGRCEDPSDDGMLTAYVKMNYLFKEMQGMLDLKPVEEIFKDLIVAPKVIKNGKMLPTFGNTECLEDMRNFSLINEAVLCPWHTQIEFRIDRYPRMITRIKCNCQSCFESHPHIVVEYLKEDLRYTCQELMKLQPALVRSEKCINGTYEWVPVLERVATACICANKQRFSKIG